MDTKPFMTEEVYRVERLICQHEGEEEYREHDHVQELWYEPSVYAWNLTHFNHKFGWDKINNYIF